MEQFNGSSLTTDGNVSCRNEGEREPGTKGVLDGVSQEDRRRAERLVNTGKCTLGLVSSG